MNVLVSALRWLWRQVWLTGAVILLLTALLLASALVESGKFALGCGAFAAIFIAIELLGRKFGWFID